MSTATTVREALRDAIRGIETTLGFTDGDYSQIHEYLLEYEIPEKRTAYLKGTLSDGTFATRAIGIQVIETDTHDQLFADVTNRIYGIEIEVYSNAGTDGSGVQWVVTATRAIRNAIKGMGTELSSTVDRVESLETTRPSLVTVEGLERREIIVSSINMEAFETNATF